MNSLNIQLIAIAVTILLACANYSWQRNRDRRNNTAISKRAALDRYFHDKKEAYFLFINAMDESYKSGVPVSDEIMRDFRTKLVFWGSCKAIAIFDDFSKIQKDKPNADLEVILCVDKLYWEIRKDLGHEDSKDWRKGMLINSYLDILGKNSVNVYVRETSKFFSMIKKPSLQRYLNKKQKQFKNGKWR